MVRESRVWCGLLAAVLLARVQRRSADIGHGQSAGATTDFRHRYVKRTPPADATALDAARLDDLRWQRHFGPSDVCIRDKRRPAASAHITAASPAPTFTTSRTSTSPPTATA
jgi:hypothetical protein